ncbi:MAG: DUF4065 domain-containing protein [Clostridiales bacterium]|nr:DUF4065 domain-containing protein [Clostridiales bacterium]
MLSPLVYANSLLKRGFERKVPISPYKLQKLIYFLYANIAWKKGIVLFSSRFIAEETGPMLAEVAYAFREYDGEEPIRKFFRDENGDVQILSERNEWFKDCLNKTWDMYGYMEWTELSALTHGVGTTWLTAWRKAKEKDNRFLEFQDVRDDGRGFFDFA